MDGKRKIDGWMLYKIWIGNRLLFHILSQWISNVNYNENYNSKREDLEEEDQGEDERNVIL